MTVSDLLQFIFRPAVELFRDLPLRKKDRGPLSWYFVATLLVILAYGLVILFSASYSLSYQETGDSLSQIRQQVIFAAVGVAAMFVIATLDYRALRHMTWYLYVLTLILLTAALFDENPTNLEADCYRWVQVFGVTFQPSELAKFSVILGTANFVDAHQNRRGSLLYGILLPALPLAPILILILRQPHYSAIILILMIFVTMLLCGGCGLKWMPVMLTLGVAVVVVYLYSQENYVQTRLDGWQLFSYDTSTMNDQNRQSVYSIASGGLFGLGIGNSRQKHQWLAEVANDFIFPVICEELGFIGAVVCLVLFAALIVQGILIALRAPDLFGSMMGIGIMGQIGWQVFCNVGVVTNTIPNTGISLPFFSSGGTSLMMLLGEMGIMLSISRVGNARIEERRRRKREAFASRLNAAPRRTTYRRGGSTARTI